MEEAGQEDYDDLRRGPRAGDRREDGRGGSRAWYLWREDTFCLVILIDAVSGAVLQVAEFLEVQPLSKGEILVLASCLVLFRGFLHTELNVPLVRPDSAPLAITITPGSGGLSSGQVGRISAQPFLLDPVLTCSELEGIGGWLRSLCEDCVGWGVERSSVVVAREVRPPEGPKDDPWCTDT